MVKKLKKEAQMQWEIDWPIMVPLDNRPSDFLTRLQLEGTRRPRAITL